MLSLGFFLNKNQMSRIINLFKDVLNRPSLYFFVFLIIFTIDRHHRYESSLGDRGTFYYDVQEYYRYLPDVFINSDSVAHSSIESNQRTIGMAILYSPGFFVGHVLAKLNNQNQDGYSYYYQWAIRWGSIIYCFIGLYYCRKSLLFYFNEMITLISLVAVFFGTNLAYYTYSWGEMPHSYLFFLYSVFTYYTIVYVKQERHNLLPLICFIGGFITLVRPTGIVVFLFPLLFGVFSFTEFNNRIKLIFSKPVLFTISFILFWLPLFLQMIIWKTYHDQFVYFSYGGGQRFFFGDPKFFRFLIGIRKGWLVYTPIMTFALIGIVMSAKKLKDFLLFLCIYFPLTVYILSCWWDWSSGGSFGCRVLIESYSFLLFPFALFVKTIWNMFTQRFIINLLVKSLLVASILFFIKLSFVQMNQLKYNIMHWSGNNLELYKFLFMKEKMTEEEKKQLKYLQSRYVEPDPLEMLKGNRDI